MYLLGYPTVVVLYSSHIAQASIGNYLISVTQLPTLTQVGVRQSPLSLTTLLVFGISTILNPAKPMYAILYWAKD